MRLGLKRLILFKILILIIFSCETVCVYAQEISPSWVFESSLTTPPAHPALAHVPPQASPTPQNFLTIETEAIHRLTSPAAIKAEKAYRQEVRSAAAAPAKASRPPRSAAPLLRKPEEDEFVADIVMDQELWQKQPNTTLEIPFGKSIILRGHHIQRFLVLDEGFLRVRRKDSDTLLITSLRRGSVLMHVWDDTGRWTFQMKGILPLLRKAEAAQAEAQEEWVKHNDHWTFSYDNNWDAFYLGNDVNHLHRTNLNFVQTLSLNGPTPYGDFYGFAHYFKFDTATKLTGQGVGLVNGNIGPLRHFSVYGYDTSKRFSELSLPGRYFRGIRWDQDLFNRKLAYSFIYGQDRSNFRVISPGITERQQSYITGAKVTLFPDSPNNYSFNFVRGFGSERPDELKPKVFSAQVNRTIKDWQTESEVAYDQQAWAMYMKGKYDKGGQQWHVSFRNYEPNFATITNFPSDRGEVGGIVSYDWDPRGGKQRFFSSLDIYRDRQTFNPEHRRDALNYDFASGYNYAFNRSANVNTGVFYTNTPQLIAPREDLRINSTFSKSFRTFYERAVTTFLTTSYQRSRFKFTPSAEYDRYSVRAGVRLPLLRDLSLYSNYEYSWVKAVQGLHTTTPSVLDAGLSYSKNFGEKVSAQTSISWRDEQNAGSAFSFLSGTDTLRGNLSLSYRPKEDMELFMDGTVRNVLAQTSSTASFNDADIRFGMRTSWDLLFSWDPHGGVTGYVYKDMNQNGFYDEGEPGIADVTVRVGNIRSKTDAYGRYYVPVHAKEVKVALDLNTLPKGYNIISVPERKISVVNGKTNLVDFGLFSRTRIYGSVFVDTNGNGHLDSGEMRIPRVILTLDGRTKISSDFEGIYQFNDVSVGEHTLTIDLNSIPLEYLPAITLKHKFKMEEGGSYNLSVPLKPR